MTRGVENGAHDLPHEAGEGLLAQAVARHPPVIALLEKLA
jgi:hypothetical protein